MAFFVFLFWLFLGEILLVGKMEEFFGSFTSMFMFLLCFCFWNRNLLCFIMKLCIYWHIWLIFIEEAGSRVIFLFASVPPVICYIYHQDPNFFHFTPSKKKTQKVSLQW